MLMEELEVASRVMPGLVAAFARTSLMDLEAGGARALADLFRECGDPGFVVAQELGGRGGRLQELAQVLRVVGARCPSLSIMMTMHHHVVASFARRGIAVRASKALLERVARERTLVGSAFAEGRPGSDVLDSTVRCTPAESGGYRIDGVKKPCTLTHHAGFVVAGVAVELGEDARSRGIALVETSLPGVRPSDFWPGAILASSDSHCLTFDGVVVPDECVLAPRGRDTRSGGQRLAVAQGEITLSCLFQVLASASYLGMASRLCECVLRRRGGTPSQRVEILGRLETAAMSVYRLGDLLDRHDCSGYFLGQSMLVALNAGTQIDRAVAACVRALGGSGYLASTEAQYLVLASRCLDFHLPAGPVREQVIEACYTDLA